MSKDQLDDTYALGDDGLLYLMKFHNNDSDDNKDRGGNMGKDQLDDWLKELLVELLVQFKHTKPEPPYDTSDFAETIISKIKQGYISKEDHKRLVLEARIDTANHLHRKVGIGLNHRDYDNETDSYICENYVPDLEIQLTQLKERNSNE